MNILIVTCNPTCVQILLEQMFSSCMLCHESMICAPLIAGPKVCGKVHLCFQGGSMSGHSRKLLTLAATAMAASPTSWWSLS